MRDNDKVHVLNNRARLFFGAHETTPIKQAPIPKGFRLRLVGPPKESGFRLTDDMHFQLQAIARLALFEDEMPTGADEVVESDFIDSYGPEAAYADFRSFWEIPEDAFKVIRTQYEENARLEYAASNRLIMNDE